MEYLRGDDGENRSERTTRYLSQLPGLNLRIAQRDTPHNLHRRSFRQHCRNLGLTIMGNRERIPFTPLPLPQRRGQRKLQFMSRKLVKTAKELPFVLWNSCPFEQQGADDMVPPPHERAERERVRAGKVFGTIQILIRKVLQMLTLHQLVELRIEPRRGHQRQAGEFLYQGMMGRFKLNSYFRRNRSLFTKKLRISQQRGLFIGEQLWMGYHDRNMKG